jgi:hypothetical protein
MSILLTSIIIVVTLYYLPTLCPADETERTLVIRGCRAGEGCKRHIQCEGLGRGGPNTGKGVQQP